MLYSTAYHPQTDGASEMTNQRVEIAFRYYIAALEDDRDWELCLPQLQHAFNTSVSSATKKTPVELIMGFTPNSAF
ncbi:MAG: hypothetical protein ABSA33_04510 [Candidatus Micrarchaeaceae archaeon]